jgi:ABC-type Zn2+ transport system substrate-binding protein/surface adhesin
MASSSSSCPNQQPIQSVSVSESVVPTTKTSILTTAEILMLTTVAPPILVDHFNSELDRRLYFIQLLSWADIRLPSFVTAAMYESGLYVSFMKILEDAKRQDDTMRVHMAAEFMKYHTAHPKEDQDDDDDDDDDDEEDEDEEDDEDEEEDSDDEDETGNNTEGVTNQTVKKQKVTHTNASTQTINESPITLDQSTST